MFTLPTADVLSFLSTDFMPIVEATEASRVTVIGQAIVGGVHVAVVEDAGTALPATATLYTPVYGDGSNAIVKFTTDGSGSITTAEMEAAGTGYTYGCLLYTSPSPRD